MTEVRLPLAELLAKVHVISVRTSGWRTITRSQSAGR